jgi:hypothetical protein
MYSGRSSPGLAAVRLAAAPGDVDVPFRVPSRKYRVSATVQQRRSGLNVEIAASLRSSQ